MKYTSVAWRSKRAVILRRDQYLCQECKRYGRSGNATTVHHIYPVESYPQLAFMTMNLISLCSECHNSMHDRQSDVIIGRGLMLQEKVAPHLKKMGINI
jgi:5-methylcytosine-specific restriction endonuclease McrA